MIEETLSVLKSKAAVPRTAVVLGSGLGAFAESLVDRMEIPYSELPHFPISTAIGHAGKLVFGNLAAHGGALIPVVVMSGRVHLYEGYSPQQAVYGVRALRKWGVENFILTNAAGAINTGFYQNSLVLISDHINLQGVNPLCGPNDESLGPRFPDMSEVYSIQCREIAKQAGRDMGIRLQEGVYAGLLGPSYETPAEIRYLRTIGADLVGMSTVAEAIALSHSGGRVLGISCVTNMACGILPKKLVQEEVLESGRAVQHELLALLRRVLPGL